MTKIRGEEEKCKETQAHFQQSINENEKQTTLEEMLSRKKVVIEMQGREKALKDQLSMYTSKYKEFHNALKPTLCFLTTQKTEIEKVRQSAWCECLANLSRRPLDLMVQFKICLKFCAF